MTSLQLTTPVTGTLLPVQQVPDPVFAEEILGSGFAIEPDDGTLYAPFAGVVKQLAPTGHSVTLGTADGAEVLMHIGVDTVNLEGQGFSPQVNLNQNVQAGETLITFDLAHIQRSAPCAQVIFVLLNSNQFDWYHSQNLPLQTIAGTPSSIHLNTKTMKTPETVVQATPSFSTSYADAHVKHHNGLHARPAALIQKAAQTFKSDIQLSYHSSTANAKSTLEILMLGIPANARIRIIAQGSDAQAAVAALKRAIEEVKPEVQKSTLSEPALVKHQPPLENTSIYRGIIASRGLALGKIMHFRMDWPLIKEYFSTIGHEKTRLDTALAQVKSELLTLNDHDSNQDVTDIQAAHLSLLEDITWQDAMHQAIEQQQTAGTAVRNTTQNLIQQLAQSTQAIFRERANDLKDLAIRLLHALSSHGNTPKQAIHDDWPDDIVLLADDLLPSVLTSESKHKIRAIVTTKGGTTSHVAIVARSLGIPFIVALGDHILNIANGQTVIVNAEKGLLITEPSIEEQRKLQESLIQIDQDKQHALLNAKQTAETLDGKHIEVCANIAHVQDTLQAMQYGADGIGLVRTELMFMDHQSMPTIDEQFEYYQAIINGISGQSAIIRTLDIGADKGLSYIDMPKEENPSLGLRGVRLGLVQTDILDTQLEALLQVDPIKACRIMLPMISDLSEILLIRERIQEIATRLNITELPELGIMIEVPSAALLANQLAQHVDFFSIGTNDLTQYVLAMDRCQPEFTAYLDGLHPAMLQTMNIACQGAAVHGKWVGVCGALAEEPLAIPLLMGMGITELSVGSFNIPQTKALVRRCHSAHCQALLAECLNMSSAYEIRNRVQEFLASRD